LRLDLGLDEPAHLRAEHFVLRRKIRGTQIGERPAGSGPCIGNSVHGGWRLPPTGGVGNEIGASIAEFRPARAMRRTPPYADADRRRVEARMAPRLSVMSAGSGVP